MLISPKIRAHPYGHEEFLDMSIKLDEICGQDFTKKYLSILKEEVQKLSKKETAKTLTTKNCKQLNTNIKHQIDSSPCAEIFLNSVYAEFYKTFKNYPLKDILSFINKLPFMSETKA